MPSIPFLSDFAGAAGGLVSPASRITEYQANARMPIKMPAPGELIALLAAGQLDAIDFKKGMQFNGITVAEREGFKSLVPLEQRKTLARLWSGLVEIGMPLPTEDQLLVLLNREVIDEKETKRLLALKGYSTDERANYWLPLRYEIPGASDLIRFVVRDVWDVPAITRFGYNEEYPGEIMEQWLRKQGLIYPIKSPPHEAAGLNFNWGRAYWWSHWNLPSPTQAYEMLHRLRYRIDQPKQPRDPSGEIFTLDDLKLLLKVNDYPPFWRGKLAAVGYRPIGIRNLRLMFALDVIDRIGVKEIFLDQGYNDRDAEIQTKLIEKQKLSSRKLPNVNAARRAILASYRLGTVSDSFAREHLYRLTLGSEVDVQAFDAMPADARQTQADGDSGVKALVLEADAEIAIAEAKEKLASIRRQRLRGIIDEATARQSLTGAGFTPAAVTRYIRTWRYELDEHKRNLSTAQIMKYARYGLLSGDAALKRLRNLNWSSDDATLLLADVARNVQLDNAKRLLAIARTEKQQQQALKAAARAAAQEARQARTALASHGTPAQLTKWLASGLIDLGAFTGRLNALGWPPDDIVRLEGEAMAMRAKLQAARLRGVKPPKPPTVAKAPVATLLKWAKSGIIGEAELIARLTNLRVPPVDIAHYVKQAFPQSQGSQGNGQQPAASGAAP